MLNALQLPALFMLLNTPPPAVPTYRVLGVTGFNASARTQELGATPGQAGVDHTPDVSPLFSALEHAAVRPHIKVSRRFRVDRQGENIGIRQAVLTALQLPPPFVLLNTPPICPRIEGGRGRRVDRQGIEHRYWSGRC